METHIKNTRRHLGELGAMSAQNEAAERKILERAEAMLTDVQKKIEAGRPKAVTDGDGGQTYQDLILERGRLQQVIAKAKQVLATV